MVSYNGALHIKSLIRPDAIEGNTPIDGRSEYVGERRPEVVERLTEYARSRDGQTTENSSAPATTSLTS
jgi:hypothetical protein